MTEGSFPIKSEPYLTMAARVSFNPYHRTVIVTAAVYWSLCPNLYSYELQSRRLTYQHWAGVSPYTLAFAFAGTCVLDKQSLNKLSLRPTISRRQGISQRLRLAFLPSSLNIFLSIALDFSSSPPVSVCGTVKYTFYLALRRT